VRDVLRGATPRRIPEGKRAALSLFAL